LYKAIPIQAASASTNALADAYVGHRSLGSSGPPQIPILRAREEFETGHLPESLTDAQRAIVSAEHLLMIFPLWHGTMPALLKGFLEQVMRAGIALEDRKHGFPKKLLAGRPARLVVTMEMPALIYRWYFRAQGARA
jgi:putative NADPH-quinone reductase